MKSKHTPGPWKAVIFNYGDKHLVHNKSGQMYIAEVLRYDADEQTEANTKLIAAAPDMLEALEWFCDRVEKGEVRSSKSYDKFKSIIKKAKGL